MRTSSGVNYDAIAHLYDLQPHRGKAVDPELVMFIAQRASADSSSILDIACGTGSQLVANRSIVSDAQLVGLDRSFGMLCQARLKARDIAWLQADGARLPFQAESFDFITCQFGFHHVPDKTGMLRALFRALRCRGRFVMRNVCPQEHRIGSITIISRRRCRLILRIFGLRRTLWRRWRRSALRR